MDGRVDGWIDLCLGPRVNGYVSRCVRVYVPVTVYIHACILKCVLPSTVLLGREPKVCLAK